MSRVPELILAITDEVLGNAKMAAIIGDNFYKSGDRNFNKDDPNALEFTIINEVYEENLGPIRVQFTLFVRDDWDLYQGEQALDDMFDMTFPKVIGGLNMFVRYANLRADVQGLPDDILGVSRDYIFTPVRSRYVRAAES